MKNKTLKIGVSIVVIAAAICLPLAMKTFAGYTPDKSQQSILEWEAKTANAPKAIKGDPNAQRPVYHPDPTPDIDIPITEVSQVSDVDKSIKIATTYAYSSPINGGTEVQVDSGNFRNYDEVKGDLVDDLQDGVIAVTTTVNGQRNYQVFHSPEKHGVLKMTSVNDRRFINLKAHDGKQYVFDLTTNTFDTNN
jgi:hypothetical protein